MATVLNIVLAIALLALFFSRLHFHFSFRCDITKAQTLRGSNPTTGKGGERAKRPVKPGTVEPAAVRSIGDTETREITSALVNLGCKRPKAQQIAERAIGEGVDFESRLRWALKNAA